MTTAIVLLHGATLNGPMWDPAETDRFRSTGPSGPLLFVNGELDRPNRKGESRFLAAFPRAKLVVFEGSPHGGSLSDPSRFGELVRDFARGLAAEASST